MRAATRKVVLLEGVSDIAALTAAAKAHHVDLSGVELVDLGGVTNVRRETARWHGASGDPEILGLCDAPEVRFVEQALHEIGRPVRDASDLPTYGFFVCHADLEEELIRALGTAQVVAVIEQLGLGAKLATLQQQPAWADRPLDDQLHRFCGVASGRKELLADALTTAMQPWQLPEPLRALIDRIAS
ncbi:hypothetical protein [Flexivirga sp. B27]